jgi:hypothetical protein
MRAADPGDPGRVVSRLPGRRDPDENGLWRPQAGPTQAVMCWWPNGSGGYWGFTRTVIFTAEGDAAITRLVGPGA